jgi:hypothetical protein
MFFKSLCGYVRFFAIAQKDSKREWKMENGEWRIILAGRVWCIHELLFLKNAKPFTTEQFSILHLQFTIPMMLRSSA